MWEWRGLKRLFPGRRTQSSTQSAKRAIVGTARCRYCCRRCSASLGILAKTYRPKAEKHTDVEHTWLAFYFFFQLTVALQDRCTRGEPGARGHRLVDRKPGVAHHLSSHENGHCGFSRSPGESRDEEQTWHQRYFHIGTFFPLHFIPSFFFFFPFYILPANTQLK